MPAYIAIMGLAAALGLAKFVLLSYFLPAESFGYYATVAGIGAVLTAILSFGRIEATIKTFPRAWADGHPDHLIGQSKTIVSAITRGTIPIVVVGVVGASWLYGVDGFVIALLSILLGYGSVLARVVSALNLSTGESRLIQNFSLFRSAFTIVVSVAGALTIGWQGAIAGEIMAAAATVAFGLLAIRKQMPFGASRLPAPTDRHLYASSLLTNASLMGDRPVVALLAGPTVAAAYAFAMMLAQMGQVFVNIIGQKMGPTIIQRLRDDSVLAGSMRYMGIGLGATAVVAACVFVAALTAMQVPMGAALFAKYGVGPTLAAIACLVGVSYFYVVMEYAVVARDRENAVLTASASGTLAFILGSGIAYALGSGAAGYVIAIGLARLVQVSVLGIALLVRRT